MLCAPADERAVFVFVFIQTVLPVIGHHHQKWIELWQQNLSACTTTEEEIFSTIMSSLSETLGLIGLIRLIGLFGLIGLSGLLDLSGLSG